MNPNFTQSNKRRLDPRIYQISVLSTLLGYGVLFLDFDISGLYVAVILASVMVTQYVCSRITTLPQFDPRSPLISGLSLCLLLRTNSLWLAMIAAMVTIASKFMIRSNGKHLFNPTNFGLVMMLLLTNQAWVSPGQWGSPVFFGFLLACIGGLVVNHAARSDVTYSFLAFYVMLLSGRALWLGDPIGIPLHQLQNGAFLIFAFFMISDPKTTPNSRAGRIFFAFLVAAGGIFIQYGLYRTNGLLWSLMLFGITTPFIDRLAPGIRYVWENQLTKTRIAQA